MVARGGRLLLRLLRVGRLLFLGCGLRRLAGNVERIASEGLRNEILRELVFEIVLSLVLVVLLAQTGDVIFIFLALLLRPVELVLRIVADHLINNFLAELLLDLVPRSWLPLSLLLQVLGLGQ